MRLLDEDHPKLRKETVEIVLRPVDGKVPRTNTGLVDPEVFTGENKLILSMNTSNLLWSFRYTKGGVPAPLKQRFTNFDSAIKFAEQYYGKRNIKIAEIKD